MQRRRACAAGQEGCFRSARVDPPSERPENSDDELRRGARVLCFTVLVGVDPRWIPLSTQRRDRVGGFVPVPADLHEGMKIGATKALVAHS